MWARKNHMTVVETELYEGGLKNPDDDNMLLNNFLTDLFDPKIEAELVISICVQEELRGKIIKGIHHSLSKNFRTEVSPSKEV